MARDRVVTKMELLYIVEILRNLGWVHIHHPDWEETDNLRAALRYVDAVREGEPYARVRLVQIRRFSYRAVGSPDWTEGAIDRVVIETG